MTIADDDGFAEHLDQVLVGGREPVTIVIADYDPAWPARFEVERCRIATALGTLARRIDHVGSTAVPGLAAKPIIDIQVGVTLPQDPDEIVPPLVAEGYVLRVQEPDHVMLRTPDRDVHVHIWLLDPADEHRHLLLRNWLRANPDDRQRYEDLKRELATQQWDDMNYYARAKGDLIAEILERAEHGK